MRQQITKEQWNELDNDSRAKLYNFLYKDKGPQMGVDLFGDDYQEFTIGRMIEFLGTEEDTFYIDDTYSNVCWPQGVAIGWNGEELCDALWEAVKAKLNR